MGWPSRAVIVANGRRGLHIAIIGHGPSRKTPITVCFRRLHRYKLRRFRIKRRTSGLHDRATRRKRIRSRQ